MHAEARERRRNSEPIYNSLEADLNAVQISALHQIEGFG
ncbi:MAG: hypothetical protein ACI9OO_000928 [Bacteroidia bacterium]|jgi:hypothetical protein